MKYITIQTKRFASLNKLTMFDKAALLDVIINYAQNGEGPGDDVAPIIQVFFDPIKDDMNHYEENYKTKCEINRLKAQKRWHGDMPQDAAACHGMPQDAKDKREKRKDKREGVINNSNTAIAVCESGEDPAFFSDDYYKSEEYIVGFFDEWWNLYDKKVGRQAALKVWRNMSNIERTDCVLAAEKYVASTPEKRFRKDPATYLKGKCWKDEIIPTAHNSQGTPQKTEEELRNERNAEVANYVFGVIDDLNKKGGNNEPS